MDEEPVKILWELSADQESLDAMQDIANSARLLSESLESNDSHMVSMLGHLYQAGIQADRLRIRLDAATADRTVKVAVNYAVPPAPPAPPAPTVPQGTPRTPPVPPAPPVVPSPSPRTPPAPPSAPKSFREFLSRFMEGFSEGRMPEGSAFSPMQYRRQLMVARPLLGPMGSRVAMQGRSVLMGLSMAGMGSAAAAAAPLVIMGAAVVGVTAALVGMEKHTLALMSQFQKASDAMGAVGSDGRVRAGGAFGIGSSLGLSEAEVASKARALMNKIATDPVAMGLAAQMGAQATPGPYGTLDASKSFIAIVDGLRNIRNEEERIRTARILGAEDLLDITHMSEEQLRRMKMVGEARGSIQDPRLVQRAADVTAATREVSESWALLTLSMKDLTGDALLDVLRLTSEVLQGWASGMRAMRNLFSGKGFIDDVRDSHKIAADAAYQNAAATAGNTAALDRLTKIINGNQRVSDALPSSVKGQNLERMIELRAMPEGIF